MELLLKIILILENDPLDKTNRSRSYSKIAGQANRIEPKFTFTLRSIDMDVWWLIPFVGVKVESK